MSNIFSFFLEEICVLLDSYKGRDKILRTLCYSSKLIGGISNNEILADKFLIFSRNMSATRATLRLLDDLPMLKYNLEYGFGKEEPDKLMAALGVTTNIIDQVYYPVEKIAWLAEHRLLTSVDGNKWDTISSIFWVSSIYLTLMRPINDKATPTTITDRPIGASDTITQYLLQELDFQYKNVYRSLRYVSILQKHKYCMTLNNEEKASLEKLLLRQNYEVLTCVRLCLDFVHAVNTLPKGFLWSSKLNTWQIGVIATASSILGIYQIYAKRKI